MLTWGEYPSDLDSHLYYFDDDGGNFHTCYYNKDYREGETLVANLDLDDTTSYGPETSTVYQVAENGVYSFYVHDYTNKDSDSSTAMSNSGAQVKLFSEASWLLHSIFRKTEVELFGMYLIIIHILKSLFM